MADIKITGLGENTTPLSTDILPMVDDPAGTPLTQKITIANLLSAANHTILDASKHTDSVVQTVTRGSLIYGNSTPKWDELVVGAANTILRSDGTDASWSAAPVLGTSLTVPILYGSSVASGTLTLTSTSHATKGTVNVSDKILMTGATAAVNRIEGNLGGNYIQVGRNTAMVIFGAGLGVGISIGGDAEVVIDNSLKINANAGTGYLGIDVAPSANALIQANPNLGAQSGAWVNYNAGLTLQASANGTSLIGIQANALTLVSTTHTGLTVRGLDFQVYATTGTTSVYSNLDCIYVRWGTTNLGGTVTSAHGLFVDKPTFTTPGAALSVTTAWGIQIVSPSGTGADKIVDYYGLQIGDVGPTVPTGNIRLLEVGPATPSFRIVGNFTLAANQTAIYISEGVTPTLRQVRWVDSGALGGGSIPANTKLLYLV